MLPRFRSLALAGLLVVLAGFAVAAEEKSIVVASTTSTQALR